MSIKANFCVIYKQKESLPEASSITDTRGENERVKETGFIGI